MHKLVVANLNRAWRGKLFFTALAIMLGTALITVLDARHIGPVDPFFTTYLLIVGSVILPLIMTIWVAVFIGTDYSDGTVRNKVIAGHTRWQIYGANLVACLAVVGLLYAAYLVTAVGLARLTVSGFRLTAIWRGRIGGQFLLIIFGLFSYTSLFVGFCMVLSNRTAATAAVIFLFLTLLIGGGMASMKLAEPAVYTSYSDSGKPVQRKNRSYLGGTKRQLVQTVTDMTPIGQTVRVITPGSSSLVVLVLYDMLIIGGATVLGGIIFKRRDLK